MANNEEKVVRVSVQGDATPLTKEVQRAQDDLKKSFEDVGLEEMLEKADTQFDKISDRIKHVKDELDELREKANQTFEQKGEGGNAAYQANIKRQQDEYNKQHQRAQEALDKFNRAAHGKNIPFTDRVQPGVTPNGEDSTKKTIGILEQIRNEIEGLRKQRDAITKETGGQEKIYELNKQIQQKQGKLKDLLTNVGEDKPEAGLGGGIQRIAGGARNMMNMVRGGGTSVAGGASELLGGIGTGGMAAGGAIAVLIGIIIRGIMDGYQEMKKDMDVQRRSGEGLALRAGYGGASTGMSQSEFIDYGVNIAYSRGGDQDITTAANRRAHEKQAYGLADNDINQFDKFYHSGGSESSEIIADVLRRAENTGILGVSKEDFTRVPQILNQVAGIMSMQKASGEVVDEGFAINSVLNAQKLGGRFADDRYGEVMGRLNSNIQNPSNGGMRAYIYEMLHRANPNASYTDVLAMQENGASSENLKALMPQIMNMPQGEMRRMILHQMFGNWQDAIRVDKNPGAWMDVVNSQSGKAQAGQEDWDKAQKRAEMLTPEFEKAMENAKAAWKDWWDAVTTSIDNGIKHIRGQETSTETAWIPIPGGMPWGMPIKWNKPTNGADNK